MNRPVSYPDRHPPREVDVVTWASPLVRRLAKATGRIEFTCVTDESFAFGCSPPRLTATQLPSATRSQTSSRRGLAPRKLTTIAGARTAAVSAAASRVVTFCGTPLSHITWAAAAKTAAVAGEDSGRPVQSATRFVMAL